MSRDAVINAAKDLRNAFEKRSPCEPLKEKYELTAADAYAIQQHNVRLKIKDGRRIVGRKVGLTSDAIQSWLGVDQPDFGTLLDDMIVDDGGVCDTSRLLQPRAEAEIAFVLHSDLAGPVTTVDVLAAIDYLLPAIEIIDSRIADWKISFEDTIADNASSGMFVLGSTPVSHLELDLKLCGMALRKNGRVVSTGAGAACLGSPVQAVTWLANTLFQTGDPLRAGDIVLSGALGPVTPVETGCHIEADIAGLGRVDFRAS